MALPRKTCSRRFAIRVDVEDTASRLLPIDGAASRICRTRSLARPTHTRCRAPNFWPGSGEPALDAAFYSYAYPAPTGFGGSAAVRPTQAYFSQQLGEFILPKSVYVRMKPSFIISAFADTSLAAIWAMRTRNAIGAFIAISRTA